MEEEKTEKLRTYYKDKKEEEDQRAIRKQAEEIKSEKEFIEKEIEVLDQAYKSKEIDDKIIATYVQFDPKRAKIISRKLNEYDLKEYKKNEKLYILTVTVILFLWLMFLGGIFILGASIGNLIINGLGFIGIVIIFIGKYYDFTVDKYADHRVVEAFIESELQRKYRYSDMDIVLIGSALENRDNYSEQKSNRKLINIVEEKYKALDKQERKLSQLKAD